MSNFIYLLRQFDRRLMILSLSLVTGYWLITCLDTTTQELQALKKQYPLSQQWHLSQSSDAKPWLKFKESKALTRGRLRTVIQYLVQQFDLFPSQIKIEESTGSGQIKFYEIFLVLGAQTDVEFMSFITYLEQELFPVVQIKSFSLHRSRTLDDSMLQQSETIQLIEGRFRLVWLSK